MNHVETRHLALSQPSVLPVSYSVRDKMDYAQALAKADLLPAAYRGKPGNVLLALEMAEAIGVRPMTAIQGVHIIEGKCSASAGLISALVRRAGHKLRVNYDAGTKTATAQIIRADDPGFPFSSVWTLKRAEVANLTGKKVWKEYPDAMLKARAITEVARDACQEALCGVQYTPEELGAEVTVDGEPVVIDITRRRPAAEDVVDNQTVAPSVQPSVQPEDKAKALEVISRTQMAFPPGTLETFLAGRKPADMTVPALRLLYKEMQAHLDALSKADAAPPAEEAKATAVKRLWATTHDAGLSEEEARFAMRTFELVAKNQNGDWSVSASTAEQINAAADWFGKCDPYAIRMGLQAEQAAEIGCGILMNYFLISCGATKKPGLYSASDLYCGSYFKRNTRPAA